MFKPNDTYVLEICWDAGLSDVKLLVLSQIPVPPSGLLYAGWEWP